MKSYGLVHKNSHLAIQFSVSHMSLSPEDVVILVRLLHPVDSLSSISVLGSVSLTFISYIEPVLEVVFFLLLLVSFFLLCSLSSLLLSLPLLSTT